VHRTDVGQSEVVHRAREIGALLAGEGSGSVMYMPFSSGFDSFYLIRTVIEYMKKTGLKLSELLNAFPPNQIRKESIFLEPNQIYAILEKIGRLYPDSLRLKDGYYLEKGESWICVRASATVNIIRIIVEGRDLDRELEAIRSMTKW